MKCLTGLVFAAALFAAPQLSHVPNRAPLPPNVFYALPLGTVKPTGWLKQQLRIQADGLSGHLDEFWPDVGSNSAWLGGTGEGWERGPYYLDHQRPDGDIGPEKNFGKDNDDWWPKMVMLKALTQYQEVTGDPRVIPVLERYFAYQAAQLAANPLHEWAQYRWGDEVLSGARHESGGQAAFRPSQ